MSLLTHVSATAETQHGPFPACFFADDFKNADSNTPSPRPDNS